MGSRSEKLDALSAEAKQQEILTALEGADYIRIDNVHAEEFWGGAVNALVDKGMVTSKFHDIPYEQYSYYEVRLVKVVN